MKTATLALVFLAVSTSWAQSRHFAEPNASPSPAPSPAPSASASPAPEAKELPDLLTELEAKARGKCLSKVSYDVKIVTHEKAADYQGVVTIAFTLDAATTDLRADFRSSAGLGKLTVNGTVVDKPVFDGVHFVLPHAALKAGANTAVVEFKNAYDHTGSGFHLFLDPEDQREYVFTDFEPYAAHRFIPCFDQPDLKASFTLHVTAPRGWEVICNAPETRSGPDGDGILHEFEPTLPLSTYLLFCGVGPWAKFTDPKAKIPSRIFCRQAMKQYVDADVLFDTTRRGLAFYGQYFGTPYAFKKYDQLMVPEFNSGAMENAGAVTFHERHLFRHAPTRMELHDRANTVLHEMAHMWFGDLVTMRWWDGLWLNESFATYVCLLALTRATPYTEAFELFLSDDKARAYLADQRPTTHPVEANVTDTDTAFSNFDGITYGKGASLLKQLEFVMGSANFQKGLAIYFKKHAFGNTEIADFFAAMSEAAGHDLTAWAELQFHTTGVNGLKVRCDEKGPRVTAFWLEQEAGNGDGKVKDHRVMVAAYHARKNGSLQLHKVVTVTLTGAKTRVLELEGTTPYAFVWPNHSDQAYLKVALDARSLEFALARLETITDGLTRRGVWQTLVEMTRDGRLAPERFVETFMRAAPRENDPKIVAALFSRLHECLDHYISKDNDAWNEKVHQVAYHEMERAAAGSDFQKTWFELAADTATSAPSLARLAELLDGKRTVKGLVLDQDKRWSLVTRLAERGAADARARIAAQLKADPSDTGQKNGLTAEAALPDEKAKAAAWKRITDGRESLGSLKALMEGFHQPNQAELSRPYVSKYFEAIPKLTSGGEQELNQAFARYTFPHYVHDPAVLEQTRAFLAAHPDLSDDVKRPILNEADELRRALAVRGAR